MGGRWAGAQRDGKGGERRAFARNGSLVLLSFFSRKPRVSYTTVAAKWRTTNPSSGLRRAAVSSGGGPP